ncbi:hypothetical protein [Arthrobacter sp. U41]|nr:hypothetical protein [Arthrobacter sp. U41]
MLFLDADVEHGTGEILAESTIDPTVGYRTKRQNTPGPKTGGVSDVSADL